MADRGEGLGRFRPGGRAADDEPPSNLRRTMHASGWMYSSRALVFGWALLLTHQFGIAEYGIYAIAFAAGAIIGIPLDSYFTVRTPRVSDGVEASFAACSVRSRWRRVAARP